MYKNIWANEYKPILLQEISTYKSLLWVQLYKGFAWDGSNN